MSDDIGSGLSSMAVCFDFCSKNSVQLSNQNPSFYWFGCHHPLITQLSLLQFEIKMKFKFSKFSRASRIDFLTGKKDRKRGGRAAIVNIHSKLGHHFSGGIWRAKDGISASDGPKRNS